MKQSGNTQAVNGPHQQTNRTKEHKCDLWVYKFFDRLYITYN